MQFGWKFRTVLPLHFTVVIIPGVPGEPPQYEICNGSCDMTCHEMKKMSECVYFRIREGHVQWQGEIQSAQDWWQNMCSVIGGTGARKMYLH